MPSTSCTTATSPSVPRSQRATELTPLPRQTTPHSLQLIDAFLVFLMLSGILQMLYCLLVTNFPFNAFLGSFSSQVGQFVLAASLRSQVNPANEGHFNRMSPERCARAFWPRRRASSCEGRDRAFADFVFGSLVLHFFAFNFLG